MEGKRNKENAHLEPSDIAVRRRRRRRRRGRLAQRITFRARHVLALFGYIPRARSPGREERLAGMKRLYTTHV